MARTRIGDPGAGALPCSTIRMRIGVWAGVSLSIQAGAMTTFSPRAPAPARSTTQPSMVVMPRFGWTIGAATASVRHLAMAHPHAITATSAAR